MNAHPVWHSVLPLSSEHFRELRKRAIFECCKWDPQVKDVETLAPAALVLKAHAWAELHCAAEALSAETMALEAALAERPDLHKALALPGPIRSVLERPRGPRDHDVRVMRFDFHPTPDGWRVSEVNSDVPGGYNEASGWTSLVAEYVAGGRVSIDPASELVEEIRKKTPPGGTVALVHATAYSDDRQVMTFLARRLARSGLRPVLVAPDHVDFKDGIARIDTDWFKGPAHFVFRFFPAEWLPNLGRTARWEPFFGADNTPLCNPATTLLTQSKRWPLVADTLGIDLTAWKSFMPETREVNDVRWQDSEEWVVKPAMGRVGDAVGIRGVTEEREWKSIKRSIRWGARHWIAQRRFEVSPILIDGSACHLCLGVYTVNGRVAGIYGRIATQPLINHLARDIAVLVEQPQCIQYDYLRAV